MADTGKIDVVEGNGQTVTPVDYKRGKRPHIAGGIYAPEKVQLCAQALLLREHGFICDTGIICFAGSKERVPVVMDETLIDETHKAIVDFRAVAESGQIPQPLESSPKCLRCSLSPICLPDEVQYLNQPKTEIRPVLAACETRFPRYVQKAGAYVRKAGAQFIIELDREKIAEARLEEVSQVVLFGHSALTTPALHECMRRNIPVILMPETGGLQKIRSMPCSRWHMP